MGGSAAVVVTLLRHKQVACGQSSYYFTYDNLYFLVSLLLAAVLSAQFVHWANAYFVEKIFPFFPSSSII